MKLNNEEIKKVIAHRDPMLLVDSVEEMNPCQDIHARFFVSPDREIFKGHFPGSPILPGVYAVECMAQCFDILMQYEGKYAGTVPLFLGIDKAKFVKKILPGDTLDVFVKCINEREDKAIVTGYGEIFVGEDLAVKAEVTIAMR